MKIGSVIMASFILSVLGTTVGAYLKILHREGADIFLGISLVATSICVISAVYKLQSSKQ